MLDCAVLLGMLICASPLSAQSVVQSGTISPGHPSRWITNGVIGDGGSATQGLLTGVGVTASGPSICANSGPTTAAFNRMCIGATQTGGGVLSVDNVNGGTGGFTIQLNGVAQGIATVTLPVTTGDAACFADTTGTLNDCGGTPVVVPCATAGAWPVYYGASWLCSTALPAGFTGFLAIAADNQNIDSIWRQSGNSQSVVQQNYFQATNSLGANTTYGQSRFNLNGVTAGSENGYFDWYTIQGGAYASRMFLGAGLYMSGLTDKGAQSINGLLYDNGTRIRTKLSANTTYYIATTGTNAADIATCTSVGTPCQTMQYVWDELYTKYDANGYVITFQLAAGTYTAGLQATGNLVGVKTENQFIISGVATNRDSVVIQPTNYFAFVLSNGAFASVRYMTLDNVNNANDMLNVGQYSLLSIYGIHFKGYASSTAYNDMTVGGFLVIGGDLYFSDGHRQAFLYSGEGSSTYLAINNDSSVSRMGDTSSGSNLITNLNSMTRVAVGKIVRGTGIPQNAIIKAVNQGGDPANSIRLGDLNGNDVNATANGTGVTLTVGGIFWNFDTVTADVAGLFATVNAGVNLQALEVSGTFTGTSYVVKNGAVVDFGTSAITVLPGSLPGFYDGATASSVRVDATGSVLNLPRIASGVISGTTAQGAINFIEYDSGGSLVTDADGLYWVPGKGYHKFYGGGGSNAYGALGNVNTTANPIIAWGIGTVAPNVGSTSTAGVHVLNALASGLSGIRLQNDDPTPANKADMRILANIGAGQILMQNAVSLYFGTNATNWLRIPTTGGLGFIGSSSGEALVVAQAVAGTPTLTLPSASGTFAVSASSPLALNATTGDLTCSTCLTTASTLNLVVGTTTIASGTTTRVLYDNAGVLGEYAQVPLAVGGTNANLTASNGGIVYSTAAALAILSGTATANLPLLSGASTVPAWASVSYFGGSTVTSGGIPYFSSTTAMASSALLGANCIVYGGGAGVAPATSSSTCPTVSSAGVLSVPNTTNASTAGAGAINTLGGIYSAKDIVTGTGEIYANNGASATNLNFRTRQGGAVSFYDSAGGRYMAFGPVSGSSAASYNWPFFNAVGTGNNPYLLVVADTGDSNVGLDVYAAGTGTHNFRDGSANIYASIGNSGIVAGGTRYVKTGVTTVGSLPTCNGGIQGARSFVTDSNAASFTLGIGTVVAAGGATAVPVTCDGTNWRIGAVEIDFPKFAANDNIFMESAA